MGQRDAQSNRLREGNEVERLLGEERLRVFVEVSTGDAKPRVGIRRAECREALTRCPGAGKRSSASRKRAANMSLCTPGHGSCRACRDLSRWFERVVVSSVCYCRVLRPFCSSVLSTHTLSKERTQ